MPEFSTLSTCPFNNNKIFIYKNDVQLRFSLMLGAEITDHVKKGESVRKSFIRTAFDVSM
jgi:hypothetical protein